MLQDNLIILLTVAAIGFVALCINYFIASREQREEARIKRLRVLRRKSELGLNTVTLLREADCRKEIIEKISLYISKMIEEIAQLAPDSDLLNEISTLRDTSENGQIQPGNFSSDKALKRAQLFISHAEKILVEMAQLRILTPTQVRHYQHDLYWLHVCVFADAHIQQGNDYMEQEDHLIALSHFKHAKAIITKTSVPQKKKKDRLETINQLITTARNSPAAQRSSKPV